MKIKKIVISMLTTGAVAMALVLGAGTASAAIVYTDQDEYSVGVGETFFIDVLLDTEGLPGIRSWSMGNLADLNTIAITNVIQTTEEWNLYGFEITEDGSQANVAGINLISSGPVGSDLDLYRLELTAVGLGLTKLPMPVPDFFWSSNDNDPVEVTTIEPLIQVVPVPAAVWLFGSALGLLGWIRKRTAA